MATGNKCVDGLVKTGKLSEQEAKKAIRAIKRTAERRARNTDGNLTKALEEIEQEMVMMEEAFAKNAEANSLRNLRAKARAVNKITENLGEKGGHKTIGEGFRAFFEGGAKVVDSISLSIDRLTKVTHQQWLSGLVTDLESAGVFKELRKGKHEKDIFIELGELGKELGVPGDSGNPIAQKIAKIIHNHTNMMVNRQNRAGAFIQKLPGWIIRQTHDRQAIRRLGNESVSRRNFSQTASRVAWKKFVRPLLDEEKTFKGADADEFLDNVHEGLYTTMHGPDTEAQMTYRSIFPALNATQKGKTRVLHFKDAESAYAYNKQLGINNLADTLLSDIFFRARNVTLLEQLGPNPELTFDAIKRELAERVRGREDAALQMDSLNDPRIEMLYNEVLGKNDSPANTTFHRIMANVRAVVRMAKMGGVAITAMTDRGFFQSGAAYNGISMMDAFRAQMLGVMPRTPFEKARLRAMGVAIDGMMGNSVARFTLNDGVSGMLGRVERRFFDINFLNWVTDNGKASAAELLVHTLGENSHRSWASLAKSNADIHRNLQLYGIGEAEWTVVKTLAARTKDKSKHFLFPERMQNLAKQESPVRVDEWKEFDTWELPQGDPLGDYMTAHGYDPANPNSRVNVATDLENRMRSFISDQVDTWIPTAGLAERKWMTMSTKSGTPQGEALRSIMMFKSFPIAIMNRVMKRDIYGRGANSMAEWITSDRKGLFWMANTIAMTSALGYMSGAIKDMLKGREPKALIKNGSIQWEVWLDAMKRGGGAGMMGDVLFQEYDRGVRGFINNLSGPIVGQMDPLASAASGAVRGKNTSPTAMRLMRDNLPFANLFYVRPILDYLVFWNLQEMFQPGSLQDIEKRMERDFGQEFLPIVQGRREELKR